MTAWHCLYGHPGAVLASGQTVLVLGTGGVSIYAAQIALAAGCRVIATSSSDEKLQRIKKELGVQETVNYRTNPEWEKEVIEKNGGRGVDHVIESESNLPLKLYSIWTLTDFLHFFESEELERSFARSDLAVQEEMFGSSGKTPFPSVLLVLSLIVPPEIFSYMSDYAPQLETSEQPEHAKEILYSQAVVRGVVCGSRDMFEDLIRCVEINKIVPVVDKVSLVASIRRIKIGD